jgi:hypothetical protein
MKNRIAKIGVLLFLGFGIPAAQAQQAIVPTGGNATGSGGTVAYTVGQLVYTTQTDAKGTVAQGVQQPFEILVQTGIEFRSIDLKVTAYPNPTSGSLTLSVAEADINTLTFELSDLNGKVLETRKIIATSEIICLDHLAPSTYIVKIVSTTREVKTFKITKN